MKRWTVRLCLVVILLTLPLGACSLANTSAAAETVVPAYGAPDYVDGSPIGGGVGYTEVYSASDADYVVLTAAELKSALAKATSGQIVYVADGAMILLNSDANWYGSLPTEYYCEAGGFYVKPGVTLAGGRGRIGVTAGTIQLAPAFHSGSVYALICLGAGAKLTGLTIDGPQEEVTGANLWAGVEGTTDAEVANCEIHGFGYVGVSIFQATGLWVHHCYIHHIQQQGFGCGVAVNASDIYHTASALVEGNRFDYGRHFMSCAKGRASYIFRYNYLGANCTNSLIDAHGQNTGYYEKDGDEYICPAGERIEVYNNTSIHPANAFVHIRGIPYSTGLVSVHHNWTYTPESFRWQTDDNNEGLYPICQVMKNMPEIRYNAPNEGPFIRVSVYDNWYGTTAPPSTDYLATNQPPATPETLWGTTSGRPGTSYTYSVKTSDLDRDSFAFTVDWGDGTTSTTKSVTSGVTAHPTHIWTEAGTYAVKARAADSEGNVSEWSPSLSVVIASPNQIPLTPAPPSGTVSGETGTPYTYAVTTTDPDGDGIAYTVDWGDGTTSTTNSVSSGITDTRTHTWMEAGTYAVKVRAADSEGNVSEWSPSLSVVIASPNQIPLTPAPPSGTVSGETGTPYTYSVTTTDPEGESIAYTIDWGDGTRSTTEQLDSGVAGSASHNWMQQGTYTVKVQAMDSRGNASEWSLSLSVAIVTASQVLLTPSAPGKTMSGAPATALQEEGISAATDASANPLPESLDTGDALAVPAHRSGLVPWLLIISVVLSAAVLLVRAIVRTAVPEAPDGQGYENALPSSLPYATNGSISVPLPTSLALRYPTWPRTNESHETAQAQIDGNTITQYTITMSGATGDDLTGVLVASLNDEGDSENMAAFAGVEAEPAGKPDEMAPSPEKIEPVGAVAKGKSKAKIEKVVVEKANHSKMVPGMVKVAITVTRKGKTCTTSTWKRLEYAQKAGDTITNWGVTPQPARET